MKRGDVVIVRMRPERRGEPAGVVIAPSESYARLTAFAHDAPSARVDIGGVSVTVARSSVRRAPKAVQP